MDKFISWLQYAFYRLICVFFTGLLTGIIASLYAVSINKINGAADALYLPLGYFAILGIGIFVGVYFILHKKRHDLSWLND